MHNSIQLNWYSPSAHCALGNVFLSQAPWGEQTLTKIKNLTTLCMFLNIKKKKKKAMTSKSLGTTDLKDFYGTFAFPMPKRPSGFSWASLEGALTFLCHQGPGCELLLSAI